MDGVAEVLDLYPRIYFACHTRHARDPKTRRVATARQLDIIGHLDDATTVTLGELARHMGVTPATMSLAVDRLVRERWVIRAPSTVDRRRVELRLTAAGARLKRAQSVLDPERVRSVLARLTRDEREEAIHGLGLLARASQEEMADGSRAKGR